MTPAALGALLTGDTENFLAAATPGGIEAQEKRGQLEQEQAQTLPINLHKYRPDFEKLGFVFGEPVDDIFQSAKFPEGWSKRATAHAMWSDILDPKGRVRGGIFYKAAFYDRHAHASLAPRFRVTRDYDHECLNRESKVTSVFIGDVCGVVERRIDGLEIPDWRGDREMAERADWKIRRAEHELRVWLKQEYPEWESVTAYWD